MMLFHAAKGEVVIFTDARQKIQPEAPLVLLENFADPSVGCASGELMLGDPKAREVQMDSGCTGKLRKRCGSGNRPLAPS